MGGFDDVISLDLLPSVKWRGITRPFADHWQAELYRKAALDPSYFKTATASPATFRSIPTPERTTPMSNTFPKTEALIGARVKLTAKSGDHSAEFTIADRTLNVYAEVTALFPTPCGLAYKATDYTFKLLQAAPNPLPTKKGLYVIESEAKIADGDLSNVNVYGMYGGTWTRYLAGASSSKITAANVQDAVGNSRLVPLAVAPEAKDARYTAIKARRSDLVGPYGDIKPAILDTVTGEAAIFGYSDTTGRDKSLAKINGGLGRSAFTWTRADRFKRQ